MGMSASQARLLSITGRITDNELKAQFITNSKLRLSAESTEATNAYTNALNSQELVFMGYDNNGEQTKISLTPALLYEYEPLKNQYILLNSSNKMLVGHTEAFNYEDTNTLSDFLRRYDLLEDVAISTQKEIINPEYDEYVKNYKEWQEKIPKEEDYEYETTEITTEQVEKFVHSDSRVYDAIKDISCFIGAQDGNRCYSHVLAALLGFGHYTTSDGNEFDIIRTYSKFDPDYSQGDNTSWYWNSCTKEEADIMKNLREDLKSDAVYDKSYSGNLKTEAHGTVPVSGDGTDAAIYNDPAKMANGTGGCWQKCIDLIWELQEMGYNQNQATGGMASQEQLEKFWYFVELDLGEGKIELVDEERETLVTKFDQDKWDEDYEKWQNEEPTEVPKTIMTNTYEEVIVVNDKDKAQWYTNLWYKMNGSDSANLVRIDEEKSEQYAELKGKTVLRLEAAEKAEYSCSYEEYDSNLYKSAEWLQFALEHGVVTMEKASFYDPAENNGRVLEYTRDAIYWQSIIYNEASDISSVDDEKAVTIAETEYKKRKNEIQIKDKKYDQDLRKLDTEHNALQTEYESLKNIIEKNVSRSFKTFS